MYMQYNDILEEKSIYDLMLNQINTLIAGVTGSGKSVLLNGFIYTLLQSRKPCKLYLADPKRVGLKKFACLPCCDGYADNTQDILDMLTEAAAIMDDRYNSLDDWTETSPEIPVYLVIDELTDLTISGGKRFKELLQHLNQLCRAANIHIIAACQSPSRKSLPAEIALNFTCKIALHCADKVMSRQILGFTGAELLPVYGSALVSVGGNRPERYSVPNVQKDALKQAVFNACAVRPCCRGRVKHQKQEAIKHSVKISKPTKNNDDSLLAYISALLASALHVLLGLFRGCLHNGHTVAAFVLTPVIIIVTAFKLLIDFVPLILFVLPFAVWVFG